MNRTHTYATLAISAAAFLEIHDKLKAAGYVSAVHEPGKIDLEGIWLVQDLEAVAMEIPADDRPDIDGGLGGVEIPEPVDVTQRVLSSGAPVPEDQSHTELKENGQQKDYVVLTVEERRKGFIRPVRRTYVHTGTHPKMSGCVLVAPSPDGCGQRTTMSMDLAESYARAPDFYSGTFCSSCRKHLPLAGFRWEGTDMVVGS